MRIPPPGNGGETEFADSRTAFEELPAELAQELLANDYIGAHTLAHSRKLGSPEFFKDVDASREKMARHRLVQRHEPSGRMNLYVAAHCHHIEEGSGSGATIPHSDKLLETLMTHVTQPKYVVSVAWQNPGDMMIWDNRSLLHRATGGSFEGKYVRDLRRTTVHDDSPTAWGLNQVGEKADGFVSVVSSTARTQVS